jgi:hypothetical protein
MIGKGLDIIINEAKKRTGASQFLRGKHSSLDPFGAIYKEDENGAEVSAPMFAPTFQAVEYSHSVPPPNAGSQRAKTKQKSHAEPEMGVDGGSRPQATLSSNPTLPHVSLTVSDSQGLSASLQHRRQAPIPPTFATTRTNPNAMSRSHRTVSMTNAQQNTQAHSRDQGRAVNEAEHPSSRRELFPVSDSRTELENMPQIYKRGRDAIESFPRKRAKQSDLAQ